ncbi:MAG: multicopper oxidase domain-containing protein [Verrucomicrobiales bacterium]|nr:multicopper oxidase domain-containing protein [Verrucomicrobiales bacterium]
MRKQKKDVFATAGVVASLFLFASTAFFATLQAREVEYRLNVAEKQVHFSDKVVMGIGINGSIPAPVLRFREGDTAVIHVKNSLDQPTSLHWHGLLVPPLQDGVPYISFLPIQPHATKTYRFPIRQAGTYWYHSHTGLQEQQGLYGAIVISPRKHDVSSVSEHVVMLSDWADRAPSATMRLLRRGSEYMGVRKKTAQSLLGAWKTERIAQFWKREAMRMPPMDLADVAYDAFLINGQPSSVFNARAGDTVKLRIVNGGTSTNFHLQYAGGPMTIVSADGQDVRPYRLNEPLFIAVAETYDVIVKVPENGSYEFASTAQDGSGRASLWIGSGEKHAAAPMPQPFVYDPMKMFGWKKMLALTPAGTMGITDSSVSMGMHDQPGSNMKMQGMKVSASPAMANAMPKAGMPKMGNMSQIHNNPKRWYDFLLREDAARFSKLAKGGVASTLRPFPPYKHLKSIHKTSFENSSPVREVRLTLDGDMNRYIWMFNNQILKPGNDIKINEGEVVRFIFINRTMMHHPLHLHGHFFRVINGQGDYSPLKHTVNVAPMETTAIEFKANEKGDWFFHCHLLYHVKAGMARVVRYNNFTASADVEANRGAIYHNSWYLFGFADVLSNMSQGAVRYENAAHIFTLEWEAGWQGVQGTEWETQFTYDRYFNRFTSVFAGVYMEGLNASREADRLIAGIRYLLPLNLSTSAWVGSDGEARITLGRELMLTPRLSVFGDLEYDTLDYWSTQAGLSYMLNQYASATALWDSNYGVGAGVTISF